MADTLFMALLEAQAAHRRGCRRLIFRPLGLTTGQPKTLYLLRRISGPTQKELAAACGIEPPSMTVLLARMESRGLIYREKTLVSGGKRAFQVYLTEKGEQMAEKVEEAMNQLEETALECLTPQERQQLLHHLEEISRRLNQAADTGKKVDVDEDFRAEEKRGPGRPPLRGQQTDRSPETGTR